jgi:hypothetical protein
LTACRGEEEKEEKEEERKKAHGRKQETWSIGANSKLGK